MNLLLSKNNSTHIAYVCIILALMMIVGCVMAADIDLKWEWPANSAIEHKLLVKVDDIAKQGSGFFGVKKSPSLAASLPDPYIISGSVENSDNKLHGKTVSLVAPKLEIGNIHKGAYVVFGLVDSTTCTCIVPVTNTDIDLKSINCSK